MALAICCGNTFTEGDIDKASPDLSNRRSSYALIEDAEYLNTETPLSRLASYFAGCVSALPQDIKNVGRRIAWLSRGSQHESGIRISKQSLPVLESALSRAEVGEHAQIHGSDNQPNVSRTTSELYPASSPLLTVDASPEMQARYSGRACTTR